MDFKENQRSIAENNASLGVLHTFQKRPDKEENCMNRKLFRTALVGLAGALMLSPMAAAAQVELNNTVLSQNEGWIENGVSYVTLNALSRDSVP